MEIENIVAALEKTLSLLRQSESSACARFSVEELIGQIENELNKIKKNNMADKEQLNYLFAPTCSLQETSIDNGWGREFLELAELCT